MKKVLFLSVFSVFCLFLAGEALAGYRGSYCTPSPNRQFGQLNWLHEDGGLFVGHLGSTRGSWNPPPACYRPPQRDYDNQRYPLDRYPRHDRRYDRRGGDALTNALASFLGAFAGSAVGNQVYQPAPVYNPPQQVYAPPPPPVVSAPPAPVYTPPTIDRRCTNFRVVGDNQEAQWAVERALRSRGYGISSVGCEIVVRYEEVGDPQARIFLRVTDASGRVRHASGGEFFKQGDTLARADAIVIAARTAVGNL